ncbi:MAG: exodeoxyribonuclease VII small subunit [Sulfurovaceae bacterium]|jgi:exodeoxyribonuclease VII small subunit
MEKKTFEQKLQYSKEILEKLMDPEMTLEASVKLYEEGLQSIEEARVMLEEAKLKIKTIEQDKTKKDD